jgi:uncharacterized surface protein with fasciclin (FAS1) repeats
LWRRAIVSVVSFDEQFLLDNGSSHAYHTFLLAMFSSAFCQSLRKTGFDIALSQDTWTVFAPTNEAIVRLGHGALNSISLEELAQVLSFHLVPDRTLLKEDLPCVAGQNLVKMASGVLLWMRFMPIYE